MKDYILPYNKFGYILKGSKHTALQSKH